MGYEDETLDDIGVISKTYKGHQIETSEIRWDSNLNLNLNNFKKKIQPKRDDNA